MPFITQERRKKLAVDQWPEDIEPGDLCYEYYKHMVKAWKKEPRWTTAHKIYKGVLSLRIMLKKLAHGKNRELYWDKLCACDLAWQVFFYKYVMPYELKKEEENGPIE